ncbi:FAD-dependent oxidoreductase [Desulfitobacterium chlororespirans]|uniref:Electron transfer flavoprotein-quinone oxidoreductase n=1 Tax=Desulfitobacterium chlororespirans DSM 11544 TaxID=1121395 RepID=A0A1M7UAS8_9FIRM|nr:FAD-dependent oxidoreductase [Desulfitobacterium chlororespirans]SHN80093.1 electron transfer flavoprotein-quinone oxidoreductase [Desulfitobacterium chlororespirans DSM 11544]
MSADKYEVIIIGAGLAGLSAAYKLARAGREVVVVERGDYPGSKNLSGGVLYSRILDQLIPDFWEEAPIERYITNYLTTLMTPTDYVNIEYKGQGLAKTPYNAVTVLRAKFDRWLAEKAEEAGAMIVTGVKVDKVLKEGGRMTGIVTGDEEMLAEVVIAADGINSFIAQEAGLRGEIEPAHLAVGAKALIELPQQVIEERFRLEGNEGTAYAMLGDATHGVAGGGFFYTNRESLSIGVVMRLDDLVKEKVKPFEVLDDLLRHPLVAPLVKDGTMTEYGAHLTAEGGLHMVPAQLHTDGMLIVGDAAGFTINSGLVIRGMDLAIGSGIAAAEAVLEAKERGDYSAAALSSYQRKLDESFIMKDLKLYAKAVDFMETDRLYKNYAPLANNLFGKIYNHDLSPKEHLWKTALGSFQESGMSWLDLARDGMKGVRAL